MFWLNEQAGARLATVAIADHPEIANHLRGAGRSDAVMIPYGADLVTEADPALLSPYGIAPHRYFISIARIEPENSILEIVEAFSRRPRGAQLMVLGRLEPETNPYHRQVRAAASGEVLFPGAIYEAAALAALRFHALAYMHGHQVGGTNPSLVESARRGPMR
ncbi:MAG: hypothetical protein WDN24_13170 [Sphingomonas sp.]